MHLTLLNWGGTSQEMRNGLLWVKMAVLGGCRRSMTLLN